MDLSYVWQKFNNSLRSCIPIHGNHFRNHDGGMTITHKLCFDHDTLESINYQPVRQSHRTIIRYSNHEAIMKHTQMFLIFSYSMCIDMFWQVSLPLCLSRSLSLSLQSMSTAIIWVYTLVCAATCFIYFVGWTFEFTISTDLLVLPLIVDFVRFSAMPLYAWFGSCSSTQQKPLNSSCVRAMFYIDLFVPNKSAMKQLCLNTIPNIQWFIRCLRRH